MFSYLINPKKTFYVKKLFNDILFLLRSGDTKEFFLPKLGQVIIISDYYKGEGLWLLTRRYYGCQEASITIGWKEYFLLWWLLAVAREAVWRLSDV